MPVFKVAGNISCELCGEPLSIRCHSGVREGWGICNECGAEYKFSPTRPDMTGGVIDMVECQTREGSFDWEIVKAYYNETGKTAVIAPFIEFEDSEVKAFHEWRESGVSSFKKSI